MGAGIWAHGWEGGHGMTKQDAKVGTVPLWSCCLLLGLGLLKDSSSPQYFADAQTESFPREL